MFSVDDVKVDYKTERTNGRVLVKMLVDDTKLVNKTSIPDEHDVEAEIVRAMTRMRIEYNAVLVRKYFDSTRGHFIGESMHKLPKRLSLWWDDDEFYLVTESPLAAPYCERMSEKQALQWARAYLNLAKLGQKGSSLQRLEDTIN